MHFIYHKQDLVDKYSNYLVYDRIRKRKDLFRIFFFFYNLSKSLVLSFFNNIYTLLIVSPISQKNEDKRKLVGTIQKKCFEFFLRLYLMEES